MNDLGDTIAAADQVRITAVEGLDPHHRAKSRVLLRVADGAELQALRVALAIDPESLRDELALMTPGEFEMHFSSGHELLASVTFVGHGLVRWSGWPFDARLREPKRLLTWLSEHGWSGTARLLLTVTETFLIEGRGLVVAPFLPEEEARRERFEVELRLPDGSRRLVTAFAQVPFITPPPKVRQAHLALLDLSKDDVPIGTEVWSIGQRNTSTQTS